MRTRILSALLVASLPLLPCVSSAQEASSDNPMVGTWTLNLGRSSYEPGPGPQSITRQFGVDDDGFLVSVRATITASGDPTFALARLKVDGQDYQVWTGARLYELVATGTGTGGSASFEMVNDRSFRLTQKNADGEVGPLGTNTWEVSADGNTLTVTTSGTAADGTTVRNVEVYDRVQNRDPSPR